MDDISEKAYMKRKFPLLYAQEDFSFRNRDLYLKNEEFNTYYYNYSTVIKLIREGKIHTNKATNLKNAPLLN